MTNRYLKVVTKDMIESHKREVKVWSYIYQLIEQDNK